MPKLEYEGVLARPGWYEYGNGTKQYKSWDELKAAAYRQPELDVTIGHPRTSDGKPRFPTIRDFVGRLKQVVDEKRKVIGLLFKPYEEQWELIPEDIQARLEAGAPTEISAAFTDRVIEGTQTGIFYNHVALVRDSENPICPLGTCGINIRVESDTGDSIEMKYEQATSTKLEAEEEAPAQQEPTKTEQGQPILITVTDAQFSKLLETLRPQKEEQQPVEPAGAEATVEEEETPVITEEPSGVPEGAFAAGAPEQRRKNPAIQQDGSVVIPVDIYHHRRTKNTT